VHIFLFNYFVKRYFSQQQTNKRPRHRPRRLYASNVRIRMSNKTKLMKFNERERARANETECSLEREVALKMEELSRSVYFLQL